MFTAALLAHCFITIFQAFFAAAEPFMPSANKKGPRGLWDFSLIQTFGMLIASTSHLMQLPWRQITRRKPLNSAFAPSKAQEEAASAKVCLPSKPKLPLAGQCRAGGKDIPFPNANLKEMDSRIQTDATSWGRLTSEAFIAFMRDTLRLEVNQVQGPDQRKPDRFDARQKGSMTRCCSPSKWPIQQRASMIPRRLKSALGRYYLNAKPGDPGSFDRFLPSDMRQVSLLFNPP